MVLVLVAYLLGSVPASYLAAKLFRGIDLRQYGTGQVGPGNLWRTTSKLLAVPAALFDLSKGLVMVWIAQMVGLSIAQQLVVCLAAIIGHNWPVFLRFSGGRGVATTIGAILILPLINESMTPWATITFLGVLVVGTIVLRSSVLPVLFSVAALPLASWLAQEPLLVTLGFLGVFLVLVLKRLTAPRLAEASTLSKRQLFFNRLFFDRDIRDRKVWMYGRLPADNNNAGK